jgi:hypothetical protein
MQDAERGRAGEARVAHEVAKWCSRDLNELIGTLTRLYGGEGVGFKYCAFCFKM